MLQCHNVSSFAPDPTTQTILLITVPGPTELGWGQGWGHFVILCAGREQCWSSGHAAITAIVFSIVHLQTIHHTTRYGSSGSCFLTCCKLRVLSLQNSGHYAIVDGQILSIIETSLFLHIFRGPLETIFYCTIPLSSYRIVCDNLDFGILLLWRYCCYVSQSIVVLLSGNVS